MRYVSGDERPWFLESSGHEPPTFGRDSSAFGLRMTGYPRIGLAIRTSLLCHSEERSDEESERSDEEILRPQNGSSVCSVLSDLFLVCQVVSLVLSELAAYRLASPAPRSVAERRQVQALVCWLYSNDQ